MHIATSAVSQDKYLDSPWMGPSLQLLFEGDSTLEGNHGFVTGDMLEWRVKGFENWTQVIQEWLDLGLFEPTGDNAKCSCRKIWNKWSCEKNNRPEERKVCGMTYGPIINP